MRHSIRFVMAGLVILAAAFPAAAQENSGSLAGAELAQKWCSDCHLVGRGQSHSNDAVPSFAAIAAAPATTAMSLHAFLLTPHGPMPDLKLSREQIDDVVAYILSLRQR